MRSRPLFATLLLLLTLSASARVRVGESVPQPDDTPPKKTQAAEEDWPMLRRDAQNTGWNPGTLAAPFQQAWTKSTGAASADSLLASGKWISLRAGATLQIFSDQGEKAWSLANAQPVYLKGDRLVAVVRENQNTALHCYDLNNRQNPLWTYPLQRRNFRSLIEKDGLLYCSYLEKTPDNAFASGVVILPLQGEGVPKRRSGIAAEAIDGPRLFWGFREAFHVVDAEKLKPLWECAQAGGNPVVIGNIVVTHLADENDKNNQVVAVDLSKHAASGDAEDEKETEDFWRYFVLQDTAHSLTRNAQGKMLILEVMTSSKNVCAFDVTTGKPAWEVPIRVARDVRTAGAGNLAFLPGTREKQPDRKQAEGGFYCVDATTGKIVWSLEQTGLRGTGIIVSNGCVYGLDNQGNLTKFVSAPPAK